MLAGNVVFLHPGITGQLNDIHAVTQRAGNGAQIICRGDKKHMAQIKWHIDKVIIKGGVLLGIKSFQQGSSRVTPEIARQLVDLVQQHQGVGALGGDHGVDDLAGHGPDIGAAVAADLCLIPHAAQADAHILAVQALGNGAGNAGLADTRRADQADDLALDIRSQLADSQHLKNAVLDLLQAVVVAVKDALCLGNIEVVLGKAVPGQIQAGIQIGADDRSLLIAALHLGKAVHFLEQFLLPLLVQMQLLDPAAVLLGLCRGIIVLAQLLADHVHLLMQVVITLVLVHGLVHFLGDFLVDLQHPALPMQAFHQQAQTADEGAFLHHSLLILKAEEQIGRDVLAQEGGVVIRGNSKHHILADAGIHGKHRVEARFHVAEQGLRLGLFLCLDGAHRSRPHRCQQEAAVGIQLGALGAELALHQNAHQIIRNTHDLLDLGHNAVLVHLLCLGVLSLHILLRNEEHLGFIPHGPFHSGNALVTTYLKMQQVVGEHHQPTQGNGGKMEDIALHLDSHFFRHKLIPPSCPAPKCAIPWAVFLLGKNSDLIYYIGFQPRLQPGSSSFAVFLDIIAQPSQRRQHGPQGDTGEHSHHKAQHQHNRRIVKGHRCGKDDTGPQQLADVVGQCAADRQDEPCGPQRAVIVKQPHHQQREQAAAEGKKTCRPAGDQKDEERLQHIQHKGLFWPHEEQGIHNHNIRQTQLHAWQKPGDDQCALDEGKRHRQSKQQT